MKQDMIKQLVEKTFSNLCSPAKGRGMYAEIEKALCEAYSIGRTDTFTVQMKKAKEEKVRYLNTISMSA